MLFFRSEERVREWCRAEGTPVRPLVTIDQLIDVVEGIAGTKLKRRYNLSAPQGVRGRVSDNTEITRRLGWAPSVRLSEGMEKTYRWIHDQMMSKR